MKNLKKFGFLSLLLMVMCFSFLTGCGKPVTNVPKASDPVVGNGGMAVQKGEYLYYVNGFYSKENIESINDNKFGVPRIGAIYKVKLDKNGNVSKDEKGFLTNNELVVPKIVGYENGGFYIFGNDIFYLTPVNKTDKAGVVQKQLLNICKTNLSGKNERTLFTSENEISLENVQICYDNGKVSIFVLDNDRLYYINGNSNSANKVVVAEGVTSFVAADRENNVQNESALNNAEFNSNVYYTRNADEKESSEYLKGNVLATYNVLNKKESVIDYSNKNYQVVDCKNNALYFYYNEDGQDFFAKKPLNNVTAESENILYNKYQKTIVVDFDKQNSEIDYIVTFGTTQESKDIKVIVKDRTISSDSVNTYKILPTGENDILLKVYNGEIYVSTDSKTIKVYNVKPNNGEFDGKTLSLGNKEFYNTPALNFDTDGINVYFYTKYSTAAGNEIYYLNRLNMNETNAEFIGFVTKENMPKKPETKGELWIK